MIMHIEGKEAELDLMKKGYEYIVIVDVEHTCTEDFSIPPNEREIIELGAVLVDIESSKIIDEYCALVRPLRHPIISNFCKELTGITQSELDKAESFKTVFADFYDWYIKNTKVIFATWGSYDLVQINIDCAFHNLEPFTPATVINLKKVFKVVNKLKKPVGLKKALELSSYGLIGSNHRALDDARNTAKLLRLMFCKTAKF
ncbi:3'-5' exonuclease [Pseudoalteromonas xiamenensis]